MIEQNLSYESLKTKHRKIRDGFPQETSLRVHRSLSWVGRAEKELGEDPDAAFIFYWIAFNAAYAAEIDITLNTSARERFEQFFYKLQDLDQEDVIYDVIWEKFPNSIRSLLNNQYVFQPFWTYQNEGGEEDVWKESFEASKRKANQALSAKDTKLILCLLFDRMYVLRNQILHGGSTWRSNVNREQVTDGKNILSVLVPRFIDLIMDNPEQDWGVPHFQVVDS